jgi:hypothetical protein
MLEPEKEEFPTQHQNFRLTLDTTKYCGRQLLHYPGRPKPL